MKKTWMRYAGLWLVAVLWLGLAVFAWVKPADKTSDSERRPLEQFPKITAENVLSGGFSRDFADYAVDQFPMRDSFRTLNAFFNYYGLQKKDNNGIYLHDGYAAKMEYPLKPDMIDFAAARFEDLYQMYLADSQCKIQFAVVPDKGYYLAEPAGALRMDYEALFDSLQEKLPWAEFLDLTDCLTAESYYHTDTHWSQDKILPVAEKIARSFGAEVPEGFAEASLDRDFYGVYYGQAALPMAPDTLRYLTWEGMEDCNVFSFDTGKTTKIYDLDKLTSRDLYDVFLSGGMAVQTITNPHAKTHRELVIFRDSFGSSLAPLLVQSYSKITLIDTRYVYPKALAQYVEFTDQDVLFLYSSLVLNSSNILKK